MAKLHGFEPITEFDGSDDEVDIPVQKPKYARQLAMVDESENGMPPDPVKPDPTVEKKEDWPDSYDVFGTISTKSRLYEKFKWNEGRIQRLEALIARFTRMSTGPSDNAVAGIYSLDGDQMEMFETLKKRFLGRIRDMKMHSYENFSSFLNRKISKIDNAWDDFSEFLEQ